MSNSLDLNLFIFIIYMLKSLSSSVLKNVCFFLNKKKINCLQDRNIIFKNDLIFLIKKRQNKY